MSEFKEILDTAGDIAEIAGVNRFDFLKQIEWAIENKEHPLVQNLHEAIEESEGEIKIGLQISLGIVVEHLAKQRTNN